MFARSMYSRLMKTVNRTDNLYLTPEEQNELLDYARSLPRRFEAARLIEAREQTIVAQCYERLRDLYPQFEHYHKDGWDKGYRDTQLVLRYNVQAMLMDDPDIAVDKLFGWLRTLLAGLDLTPQLVRDTFTCLRDACAAQLPAEAQALLEPHLNRTIEVLADFPEPALAAV
ncbi:MAG: hypothetical protein JNM56_08900 [Planctomycetia bacterium]|nr:hypothetical protein [Planctomycetia bacterium]